MSIYNCGAKFLLLLMLGCKLPAVAQTSAVHVHTTADKPQVRCAPLRSISNHRVPSPEEQAWLGKTSMFSHHMDALVKSLVAADADGAAQLMTPKLDAQDAANRDDYVVDKLVPFFSDFEESVKVSRFVAFRENGKISGFVVYQSFVNHSRVEKKFAAKIKMVENHPLVSEVILDKSYFEDYPELAAVDTVPHIEMIKPSSSAERIWTAK